MFSIQEPRKPIITITGGPKTGKSTAADQAEKTSFIQIEDVGDGIKSPKTPLLKTFKEVLDALGYLATQEHNFETVAVDSLDWLENLIHKQICEENNVKNIEKIGYGKGYVMANDLWRQYIDCIKHLRDHRNMMVIQIAHTEIKRFENPETEPYDRYQMKLYKGASDLIMESSDIILFINFFVGTTKTKNGFNGERVRAVGTGDRVIYTEERPAFKAGNRFGLPPEIPYDRDGAYWSTIAQHVPYYQGVK